MLDIDHFKRINDTFGHDAGDAVLREIAGVLRESTRAEDLVARYGGEEFVIALPVAAPDQATDRAERIRSNLSSRQMPGIGETLTVTASLGLSYAEPGADEIANRSSSPRPTAVCIKLGKREGRDRLVFRQDPFLAAGRTSTLLTRTQMRTSPRRIQGRSPDGRTIGPHGIERRWAAQFSRSPSARAKGYYRGSSE